MHKLSGLVAVVFVSASLWGAEMPNAKTVTNSVGMKMTRVEAGRFLMGSADGEWDERPIHEVTISKSFYLGATEVTNAQYERFDPEHRKLRGKLGYSRDDDEAVVFVSWEDATAFCKWLSEKEGQPYHLPTEAQWEYACRAGTSTPYSTGRELPQTFQKNVTNSWFPSSRSGGEAVPLHVGKTRPNLLGLMDMHGNVEEWCLDWYGPYGEQEQTDPIGRANGDFRVARGGSHSTTLEYLRSANRSGALPEDRHWLIGFRVALGEPSRTKPFSVSSSYRWAHDVRQDPADWSQGPDPTKPYFKGPIQYVKIPPGSEGPVYSRHNHCPALVACPNGDLLAIWYSCRTEPGRELGIVASRLRRGSEEWEEADPFWDTPDRNDHAPALYLHEDGTIFHFNGMGAAGTWGALATILRTSTDNGVTWSRATLIMPEHGLHHMPIESVFRTREGNILVPCDAETGGNGGSAILISRDGGKSWTDPGEGRAAPKFAAGETGAWIAGIHAGVVQLKDGRLMALGRGNTIDGKMPTSISADTGQTWTYHPSVFPPIGGGQRLVLTRLNEGPLFFASFATAMEFTDAAGGKFTGSGLFAALSYDEGRTWDVRRLITAGGPARRVDGGGNTGLFTMSDTSAEPKGYMSVHQTPDNIIHLITSKQYYAFNLAWLKQDPPAPIQIPTPTVEVRRFGQNPIIRPQMLPGRDGSNINGPSLVRVPTWVPGRLGNYYLYFAHHNGKYIRLAYADHLEGLWRIHEPGTLTLTQATGCTGHIASPDVHVDEARQEIRMYFHGPAKGAGGQKSFVAVSKDGLYFKASEEPLGLFYFRVFRWQDRWYAMAKGGLLYRSKDGLTGFEQGPNPFPGSEARGRDYNGPGPRHVALHRTDNVFWVYYSSIGDEPERILRCSILLADDWHDWKVSAPEEVLRPQTAYEGVDVPLRRSAAGAMQGRENALRDPAIFTDADGRVYLLYSVAGESGIAIAELKNNAGD